MFPKKKGCSYPQSYVLCLAFSAWFFLIFSPFSAQAQLDTTVTLDISDNGKSVTVNKKDTIGIMLQSNLTPNYQWILDTSGLNTEVVGEIGVFDVSDSPSDQNYRNDVESGKHYIQWIFTAKDSGSTNIKLNYKNLSDNDILRNFEIYVTVPSDPNEKPAPFSLVVLPNKIEDSIAGQKCVFLVKIIDEGPGYGKGEAVNISTVVLDMLSDTVVNVNPPAIIPGQVGQVTVIPGQLNGGEEPNVPQNPVLQDQIRPGEPIIEPNEPLVEEKSITVTIMAKRAGVQREQTVTVNTTQGEDDLAELASTYRDRFIPWLAENYPEFGITEETEWVGTIVRPHILVVMYYLFFSEEWEMGLRWHVMIPPYDFAEIYLRKRDTNLSSIHAFKIFSLDAQDEPQVVDLPQEGIWR
jgi:predicted secreted protein